MKWFATCLFLLSSCIALAQKDSVAIAQLIIKDYTTMQNWDLPQHLNNCTHNYILIEKGVIQNMAQESEYYKKNVHRQIKRTDSFNFKNIRVYNNMGYAVYTLQSQVIENGITKNYHWSESVVCRRIKNQWKIELIHSTALPEN
ncbi:MAG: hypothetical protein QM802_09635 [Agriterribacter sp.]